MSNEQSDDIAKALERLGKIGLIVRCNQEENRISGGYKPEFEPLMIGELVDGFFIKFDREWEVRKRFGQLIINIRKPALSEAVDAVCRLYEAPTQFSDDTITVDEAVEKLKHAGQNVSFTSKKVDGIIVCFNDESGHDCTKGIGIMRKGGYFLVIKFGGGISSGILRYSETLREAVEFILSFHASGEL